MTVNKRLLTFIICSAIAGSLSGEPVLRQHILAPIVQNNPVNGANGSVWVTELFVFNGGNEPIEIFATAARECGMGYLCDHVAIAPGQTTKVRLPNFPNPGARYGLYAEESVELRVSWNLRVRDLSRQELTYGTEIPLIPIDEGLRTEITLPVVPLDERFRQALRVYGPKNNVVYQADLMIWDLETGSVLVEDRLEGSIIQILDLVERYPQLAAADQVRIRLTAATQHLGVTQPIWAFVSITHDETQHVTLITPQP